MTEQAANLEQNPSSDYSSSDDGTRDCDLTTKEGRKKGRKTRRERIESQHYQEFGAAMLKDPRRYRWAAGCTILYIIVKVVADTVLISSLVKLANIHNLLWTTSGLTTGTAFYFTGNAIILLSGASILYYIFREKGLENSRGKLYYSCLFVLIGAMMELILMVPFMLTGPRSLTGNQNQDECIQNLKEDQYLFNKEWTIDQEEKFCSLFLDGNWLVMKWILASTFCGQIIWLIILFEFCCLVMSIFNPSKEIWKTYRLYRKNPVQPLPIRRRIPRQVRRSTQYSEYSIGSNRSPLNLTSSNNLMPPTPSGGGDLHSTTSSIRKTMDKLAILT